MGIEKKTLGILIDELITTNLKCWFAQEVLNNPNATDEELAEAFRKAQTLNARRNGLIRAIDNIVGEDQFSPTEKTYK